MVMMPADSVQHCIGNVLLNFATKVNVNMIYYDGVFWKHL